MKRLILVLLGLLVIGCIPRPASQAVERVIEEIDEVTKAIEPEPTSTATALPALTATPTLPLPTLCPTDTPAPPTPTPMIYIVQAGDTLAKIAAQFHVSVEAIATVNQIQDVNQIEVGQALTMPTGAVTSLLVTEAVQPAATNTLSQAVRPKTL